MPKVCENTKRPVDYVDPLIDTAKPRIRWIFTNLVTRPFGMVSPAPDTSPTGTWASGYMYGRDRIHCFSHIHAWQLSGVPVMPVAGAVESTPTPESLAAKFRHEDEISKAGYYSVKLKESDIRVELTATPRAAFHRVTFPSDPAANLVFNLGMDLGPGQMSGVRVQRVGDDEIEGCVVNAPTRRRPKECAIHFVARFNRPFNRLAGWTEEAEFAERDEIRGDKGGVALTFDAATDPTVLMKIGVSYVSVEGARTNVEAELPSWDFDGVVRQSQDVWNEWLSRITVEGGSERRKTKFHTDLYRASFGANLVSDVDGAYIDRAGDAPVIRRIPLDEDGIPRYAHYQGDGLWECHWSKIILWSIAYPEILRHFCNFLVDIYKDGGLIPRAPSGGNYTFVMIGAQTTPLIVAAHMKGIRGFNVETAYEGLRKNAFPGGLMSKAGYEHRACVGGGIEHYLERGYIPERGKIEGAFHTGGGAQTLEYCYADWTLAQLAKALGKEDDYRLFMKRAENYKNLFDAATKFMRPRKLDGSWLDPFNPLSLEGWCEGNSWQYTFYVPHDLLGLIRLFGGPEPFVEKINLAFERATESNYYAPKVENIQRDDAYINYGNENGRFTAHLFNHAGAPWLTQKWTREVRDKTYGSIAPEGFFEDDDYGLAASTSVLLALGLFDMRGGAALEPVYEIASPAFDKITIKLDPNHYPGETFVIETKNDPETNPYIQSATLNGRPLDKCWFLHEEFANGGKLVLELGPEPNKEWGAGLENAPPSMSREWESGR